VADIRDQRVTLPTTGHIKTLFAAARRIEDAGVAVADVAIRRPSLDDVFLTLTGPDGASPAERPGLMPGESPAPKAAELRRATA
jgi:hypothetical protein